MLRISCNFDSKDYAYVHKLGIWLHELMKASISLVSAWIPWNRLWKWGRLHFSSVICILTCYSFYSLRFCYDYVLWMDLIVILLSWEWSTGVEVVITRFFVNEIGQSKGRIEFQNRLSRTGHQLRSAVLMLILEDWHKCSLFTWSTE